MSLDSSKLAVTNSRDGGAIIINISNFRAQSTVYKVHLSLYYIVTKLDYKPRTHTLIRIYGKPYIVLECYPWLKSYFVLLSGMVMYDNEFKREENSLFEIKPNLNQG